MKGVPLELQVLQLPAEKRSFARYCIELGSGLGGKGKGIDGGRCS